MMKWVERIAKSEVNAVTLQVFGHNTVARGLYEKKEYVEFLRDFKDEVVSNLFS